MKFKLIIDKEKDEEVVATVRERSALTDRIELLVIIYHAFYLFNSVGVITNV